MKKKILIIDDDQGILEAIKAILEFSDYQVETSDYSEKLILKEKNSLPDLILLDLLLSGKDGKEIAKELKGNSYTSHIPIIMLSAYPTASEAAKLGGADDFLAKPYDMDELLKKIKNHLKD